jgi:hypothetical protein
MNFEGLDSAAARAFAERWLPAWSGNRPDPLVAFDTGDACYSDAIVPQDLRGRGARLAYPRKRLAAKQVDFDRSRLLAAQGAVSKPAPT